MSKSKASMTKDDYIKAEIKRLKKIFANLTQDASAVAEKLIENAAFMAVSLTDLQRIINEKGYTEEYQKTSLVQKSRRKSIFITRWSRTSMQP